MFGLGGLLNRWGRDETEVWYDDDVDELILPAPRTEVAVGVLLEPRSL